jgi:5'-3' exonuclease
MRLMVVDALNQFLRSYIVDPSMSANGQPVGGSKGFLKILNKLVREIKPDKVVVVWDGEGGSKKRKSINKNYKAGRTPAAPRAARMRLNRTVRTMTEEEEASNKLWQLSRVLEYLNCTPVIQLLEPSVEADDIIAAVVQHPSHQEWQKVIVSSDKDFFQLLDDKTLLYRPTQKEILNKKIVLEKYGVHPSNFALARAMVGDTSDNLPGLKGVGLGTVAKRFPFLSEEKSYFLDDIVEDCLSQESPLKVHHTVVENQSIVKENYKMMQLYVPSLSAQTHAKVKECMTEFNPEFNKSGLRAEMMKDGLGEISLFDLFTTFNRIVSDSNK